MLLEHLPALNAKRIVLGSASPRRRELLQQLGLHFEVVVSNFEETLPHEQYSAVEYAKATASHKALDIARLLASRAAGDAAHVHAADLVICADTVVEHEGRILEKPNTAEHARAMLTSLSGTAHYVHTGVALALPPEAAGSEGWRHGNPRLSSFGVTTEVVFSPLSAATIEAYIDSGEPFGKAGSYGIQGLAGVFVESLTGDYFNVVGLPLNRLGRELQRLIESGQLVVSA